MKQIAEATDFISTKDFIRPQDALQSFGYFHKEDMREWATYNKPQSKAIELAFRAIWLLLNRTYDWEHIRQDKDCKFFWQLYTLAVGDDIRMSAKNFDIYKTTIHDLELNIFKLKSNQPLQKLVPFLTEMEKKIEFLPLYNSHKEALEKA